jgi:hypothetical protein
LRRIITKATKLAFMMFEDPKRAELYWDDYPLDGDPGLAMDPGIRRQDHYPGQFVVEEGVPEVVGSRRPRGSQYAIYTLGGARMKQNVDGEDVNFEDKPVAEHRSHLRMKDSRVAIELTAEEECPAPTRAREYTGLTGQSARVLTCGVAVSGDASG